MGFALVLFCWVLLVGQSVSAAPQKTVRTNPFAQPLVVAAAVARSSSTDTQGSRSTESARSSQLPLQLRGVLRAGADSFANVAGEIVGLEETVFGMRLISVTESAAVFMRDGEKVVLEVSPAPLSSSTSEPVAAALSASDGKSVEISDKNDTEKDKRSVADG